MSAENPLKHASLVPLAPAQAASPPAPPPQKLDVYRMAQRYLRGRYRLVVVIGLVTALFGSLVGWKLGKRVYRSEAMIEITYAAPTVLARNADEREPVEIFQGFLQSQELVLGGRRLAELALQQPQWKATGRGDSRKTLQQFLTEVKVEAKPGTDFLDITFTDANPEVAAAGVQSLVAAYHSVFAREDEQFQKTRLNVLSDRRADLRSQLLALQEKAQVVAQGGASGGPRLSEQEIAITDQSMRAYLSELERLNDQLQACKSHGYGPNHPEMVRVRTAIENTRLRADDYADTYRAFRAAEAAYGGTGNANHAQLDPLKMEIDRVSTELAQVSTRFEALQDQVRLGNQLRVITAGEVPLTPFQDRRLESAGIGAATGGLLPAAIVVLIGLVGGRYRYSDEPAEDLSSRVRLLGILPMLSSSPLKDRERAIGAAQCVHQIRVMLELGHSGERHPVYLVSSASPGEGKTSLTASLGLSFAASGSNTLLIDIDLMGHRLTRGFTDDRLSGLCDVLATGKIEGHPRKTTRENLELLPVGRFDALHAGTLSSSAVQTLVSEARKHYDVVLIDSGPMLGSVEASLVTPEVDGVLLVVARHQQRALVDRAIRMIDSVGGKLAGLVFNRAEVWDFQRSMSSSNRSVDPDGVPARLSPVKMIDSWRLGPLVRSVASFLPEDGAMPSGTATAQ